MTTSSTPARLSHLEAFPSLCYSPHLASPFRLYLYFPFPSTRHSFRKQTVNTSRIFRFVLLQPTLVVDAGVFGITLASVRCRALRALSAPMNCAHKRLCAVRHYCVSYIPATGCFASVALCICDLMIRSISRTAVVVVRHIRRPCLSVWFGMIWMYAFTIVRGRLVAISVAG